MAKQSAHHQFFQGTNFNDLTVRALHAGLGKMIDDYDAANSPADEEVTTAKRGRKPGRPAGSKPGRKPGRPAGTGAKRGRPAGSGRGPGRPAKSASASKKKAYTGAKRGRKSNAEKAALAAKEAKAKAKAKPKKAAKPKVVPVSKAE